MALPNPSILAKQNISCLDVLQESFLFQLSILHIVGQGERIWILAIIS
jgi:hypothetical protein